MADVFISEDTLTAIGDAIRAKTGNTELINPVYMAEKISTISSGGVNPGVIDGTLTVITAEDLAGVTKIRDYVFYKCTGLTSVTIPDSVTSIGDYAFSNCKGLASVTIPDSVTSIGEYAFEDCIWLTSVTIPDSVTSISDFAFEDCSRLTSITIPDSVTSIGDCAFFSSGLTAVTIPDSVTSIGYSVFEDCSALASVIIGNSVTSIGECMFCDCTSLTSVTIPESITSIGEAAFYGCTGLAEAVIEGDTIKTLEDSSAFTYTSISRGTGFIYIKISDSADEAALVEEYKNATNWTTYANQIKGYSEYPIEEE